MTFNLPTTDNNWNAITGTEHNFERFLNAVVTLEGDEKQDWVKWKSPDHQVVIQTPQYYYKLYEMVTDNDVFYFSVREQLADIYKQRYGIHWEIKTITDGNTQIQIEQREKLEVITDKSNIGFQQILLQWQDILEELEEKLLLPQLTRQMQEYIPNLDKIKLIRDCINKYPDYAIKDNHIILLDDADWFLALIDKEGNWLEVEYNIYPDLVTIIGDALLIPCVEGATDDRKRIQYEHNKIRKWTLVPSDRVNLTPKSALQDVRTTMIENNIKLLHTGDLALIDTNRIQPLAHDNKLGLSFSA